MSEGQGNISYSSQSSGASGGIVVSGARNGVSVDSSGFIVLGQSVGHAGDPAEMLDDQEVPMQGFYLNLFDGMLVLSNTREPAVGVGLLQIIQDGLGDTADMVTIDLFNNTPATNLLNQNSPSILFQGQSWDSVNSISKKSGWVVYNATNNGSGTSSGAIVFAYSDDGGTPVEIAGINNFGQMTVPFVDAGDGFITNGGYSFEPLLGDTFEISTDATGIGEGSLYLVNTSGGGVIPTAFSAANFDDTTNREYFKLGWNNTTNMLILSVEAQGTGVVRPVAFLPNIMFGTNTAPTAIIHMAPGTSSAGTSPLKFSPGTLLGVPEEGSVEFDGDNLYLSLALSVRETILATPTPLVAHLNTITNKLQVSIGGTTYYILASTSPT